MKKLALLILAVLILAFTGTSNAEIYKWTDKNGQVHFGDAPPPEENFEALDEKELANRISSVSTIVVKLIPVDFGVNQQTNMLTMYSTSRCGYCKKARHYFKENNITYIEKDVENSQDGKREYKKLGGTGVPLFWIGKYKMQGFSEKRFDKFYARVKG